jgi:peptidoglycan/LPS O-acetylase OafA/YrhL
VALLSAALVPAFLPTNSLGFPVFALACAIIIDRLRSGAWDIPDWIVASRVWAHLSFLGVMSYSFYLLHQPFIQVTLAAVDKYFPDLNLHPLTRLAIAVAVYVPLMPVSYAFFKIFERPSIRLGELVWAKAQSVQNRASVGTA